MGWNAAEQAHLDQIGYNSWVEEQLAPEEIDDSPLEDILARARPTLEMTPVELYERYENQRAVPIFQLVIAVVYLRADCLVEYRFHLFRH